MAGISCYIRQKVSHMFVIFHSRLVPAVFVLVQKADQTFDETKICIFIDFDGSSGQICVLISFGMPSFSTYIPRSIAIQTF